MAFTEFYMQTTGNDANAGSTNADAASVTSTNGDWGIAAANRFTAAAGTPFSGVSVGEYASVYLDGATAAVYVAQVTAVNAGGASIDLSATVKYGTAPTTGATGRSCKIGGAWAGLAVITSLFTAQTVPQSTRINIKAGTYATTTTNRTAVAAGSATVALWWRGYKTTIGDQDSNNAAVAGTDIPAITSTTGTFTFSGARQIVSSLDFAGAPAGILLSITGTAILLYAVRSNNTNANSAAKAAHIGSGAAALIRCNFKATTAAIQCVNFANAPTQAALGCICTGGAIGFLNPGIVAFCVFDSQAGDAIQIGTMTAAVTLINNSIYAPTGNGVNITGLGANQVVLVANNYFENVNQASKAAINNTTGTNTDQIRAVANGYYNCTANTSGITEGFAIFDNGTLASAAFSDPGNQNFAIGSIAKALGFPGVFEGISAYQGYLDLGAVQRQEPTGGGGSHVTVARGDTCYQAD